MANGNVRIDVDTSGAQKNVQALIDRFNGMTKPLTSASNAVSNYVNDMKKTGQSLTTVSKKQVEMASALGKVNTASQAPRQALSELKRTLENVTVAYNSLTSQEKASPFGQALKGSITQLTDRAKTLQSNLKGVSDSLKDNGDKANNTSGILSSLEKKIGMSVKSFLSLNTALAAVGAALKVAKDAFFASEENIDHWGESVRAVSDVYEGFLASLNNGDISGFLSNIDDIINAAKDAYDALDTLGTMKTMNSPAKTANEAEIERIRAMLRTGKYIAPAEGKPAAKEGSALTKAQTDYFTKRLEALLKSNRGYSKQELNQSKVATSALEKEVADRYNMSVKDVQTYTKDYSSFAQGRALYTKYATWERQHEAATINMQHFKAPGVFPGTEQEYWKQYRMAQQKTNPYAQYKGLAGLMSMKTDEEGIVQDLFNQRKESSEMMKSMYAEEGAAYRSMSTAANRFNTHHTQSNRGGGSGSGNTTTKTGPVFTEDAQTTQQMSENVSVLESKLKTLTKGSEEYVETLRQLVYWKKEYNRSEINDKGYTDFYSGKGLYGLKAISIMDTYGKTSEPDENFKISEEKLPDLSKLERIDLSQFANSGTNTADAWQAAASAISSAGSAMQGLGNTGLNIAGIIAQAIANIAMGMASMLASPASTAGGPWTWVAAAASGVATMVSTIAAIHSATGYAEGGVVGGNSYSGDRLYARLNSGEVVLNQNQIARANNALDNSAGNASRSTIRGEQIVSVLRAYTRRTGRSLGEQL